VNTYVEAAKAIKENPDLHSKITSATTAEDRAAALREHGVEVPTHADVNAHTSNLEGVSGAGSTTTAATKAAPAAVPAAAAAFA
jgi:hypothetical protein